MGIYIIHATHECVIHEKCDHRLVSDHDKVFTYEKLRQQICDIFQLPPSAVCKLTYTDWNSDPVSIVNDADLVDGLC